MVSERVKILGVDPGNTTGLAMIEVVEKKIVPIVFEESKDTTTLSYSELIGQADVLVIEDWKTRPKKAKQGAFDWDPMITARIIGALEVQAGMLKIPVVLQQASNKPVGYGLSNQVYKPGKRGTHKQDALAHAVFYAVRVLYANPVTGK